MELKLAFGRRIKTLRELRGLTQNDLAAELERSVDAVSMIERGKNWPSVPTIERLALVLQVSTTELFNDLGTAGPSSGQDLVVLARELLPKLGQAELEVAVATLEALARKSSVNGEKRTPPL
ncbi:helix-turn-helix domain-containing protein [Aminobacter aminovorans]|uniref:Transcriptional regulator n=1 Tax=Aminobacter aminovorans TaxID=83263 RepID=A0AAC8YL53_AMIAI|nr:helix-turn-helix transcriptional regulator [Aminobacter aminovorans]AMS40148.1 Transcriptional regulator [Aminobacter aminovorans]MBB3709875.1 transcriptional regulator with XRE-family HTH domain [Aminobacter aminovorans]